MILTIYDRDFAPVGMIEEYETCSWIRRFRSRGECTVSVPYSPEALEILQVENFLYQQNGNEAMIITTINLTKDQTGADKINVTGYGLFQLLNRRVCDREYTDKKMNAQEIIYSLIESNITKPKEASRRLPYVVLNKRDKYTDLESSEFSLEQYQRLGDTIEEQLSSSELGCVITSSIEKKTHTFDFRKPTVHTAGSESPIIFSVDYGTLGEQEFMHSHEQYANMAYVTGGDIESEDAAYKNAALQLIGNDLTGYDRFEVGVNASDIVGESDEESLTPKQVRERLIKRGQDEMKNSYPEESTFTGKIIETDSLVYKQDWDLGDRVTCMYNRWGISADLTITEIQEEYSKTGRSIIVTFGEGTPDFRKTLCALVRRTK